MPPRRGPGDANAAAPDRLAQLCGEDSRDIAGLPIDLISRPSTHRGTACALDELANASIKAAQNIRAACPTAISLTAPSRLTAMQQRIEAMIAAVATVQPPLDKFYGLLNDEQKARLNALAEDQRRNTARRGRGSFAQSGLFAQSCNAVQPALLKWPAEEIDARLNPTDAQRADFKALQDANATAAEMLATSCPTDNAVTLLARLAASGKRLDTMLEAVKLVRSALDNLYATLSDEQKAQFEAIGPRRTSYADRRGRR